MYKYVVEITVLSRRYSKRNFHKFFPHELILFNVITQLVVFNLFNHILYHNITHTDITSNVFWHSVVQNKL